VLTALGVRDEEVDWRERLRSRLEREVNDLTVGSTALHVTDDGIVPRRTTQTVPRELIVAALADQALSGLFPGSDDDFVLCVALERRTDDPALRQVVKELDGAWDEFQEVLDTATLIGEWWGSEPFGFEPFPPLYAPEDGDDNPYSGDLLPVAVVPLRRFPRSEWPITAVELATDDIAELTIQRVASTIDHTDRVLAFMGGGGRVSDRRPRQAAGRRPGRPAGDRADPVRTRHRTLPWLHAGSR
jgi:hypothetical protein